MGINELIAAAKQAERVIRGEWGEDAPEAVDIRTALATVSLPNQATCRKCGVTIESKHRHDYVQCPCGAIAIDGGRDYQRRIGNPADFMPLPNNAQHTPPQIEETQLLLHALTAGNRRAIVEAELEQANNLLRIERERSNQLRAALGELQLILAPAGPNNWERAIKAALQIIEEAQRG
jgi:hypothetical protein